MKGMRVGKGVTAAAVFLAIIGIGMSFDSRRVRAGSGDGNNDNGQSKAEIGLRIAPVNLEYEPNKRELVGLGSYIVNAQADCNGCHNSPQHGGAFVTPTGFPYFLKPPFSGTTQINKDGYLGGGNDFGPYPGVQHLYTRNLTPDKSGRAAGGMTLQQFMEVFRKGTDFDNIHPTCTGAPNGSCLPQPFDGSRLQIMPWPIFGNMSDRELESIYAYLSAIPCISHNDPSSPYYAADKLLPDYLKQACF